MDSSDVTDRYPPQPGDRHPPPAGAGDRYPPPAGAGDRYPPPASAGDHVSAGLAKLTQVGWVLLPARLFLGVTFVYAGLDKISDPSFWKADDPSSIQSQLAYAATSSPIHALVKPLQDYAVPLGVVIAIAEVAIGLGALLGLFTRLAALGGLVLSLNLFLTVSYHVHPYYLGNDLPYAMLWLTLVLGGSGGVLSLDGWRRRAAARDLDLRPDAVPAAERAAVERRALVRGGVAAAGVGVLALVGAGLARWLGWQDAGSTTTASGPSTSPTASATPSASPTGTASPPPTAAAAGKVLAKTSAVPVGGSATATLENGKPAIVVQPTAGDFKAFSAICTHQGCTVAFVGGNFRCPCHGGQYSGSTGAVLGGPPPAPLSQVQVVVDGGDVHQA